MEEKNEKKTKMILDVKKKEWKGKKDDRENGRKKMTGRI